MVHLQIAAMLAASAAEDAKAMKALTPGQDWTKVVYDADQARGGFLGHTGSLRVRVGRGVGVDPECALYCVALEEEVDCGEWRTYRDPGSFGESDHRRYVRAHVKTLADTRPFFAYVPFLVEYQHAMHRAREAWSGDYALLVNGDYEPESPDQSHVPQPTPAPAPPSDIPQLLALKVGERYIEERPEWTDIYVPNCQPHREKGYARVSYRFLVERCQVCASDAIAFHFWAEEKHNGEAWENSSFGLDDEGKTYERYTQPPHLGAHLDLYRTLIRIEQDELTDSGRAEREEYGITDEHLRTRTISDKSLAELDAEDGAMLQAAASKAGA